MLDALAASMDGELRTRLGPEIADAVTAVLRRRALDWARAAAGAGGPAVEVASAAQLPAVLAGHDGPVLVAAPDVPGLGAHHVRAAADDFAHGILLSSAPATDGVPFLIALARPDERLLTLAGEPFDVLAAAVLEAGGQLGMLRPERRLATLSDARALRADPLAPRELRDLLPAAL